MGLGFARSAGNWQDLITEQTIDLVDVTTPNVMHERRGTGRRKERRLRKPLPPTAGIAKDLAARTRDTGAKTMVGLTCLLPCSRVGPGDGRGGEIGEVVSVRGHHLEGYMADPDTRVAP